MLGCLSRLMHGSSPLVVAFPAGGFPTVPHSVPLGHTLFTATRQLRAPAGPGGKYAHPSSFQGRAPNAWLPLKSLTL